MSAARQLPHLWKNGQSGNPGGRPRLPEELRAIKSVTPEELAKIISKYARFSIKELEATVTPETKVMDGIIVKILSEALKKGDQVKLDFLLNRAIGKPREAPPFEADDETARALSEMSDHDLLQLVKEKLPEMEKACS